MLTLSYNTKVNGKKVGLGRDEDFVAVLEERIAMAQLGLSRFGSGARLFRTGGHPEPLSQFASIPIVDLEGVG